MRRGFALFLLLLLPLELRGSPAVRAVLVFPFENQSARADLNWIAESFAETLSVRLAGPENYLLGREERSAAYAQLNLPPEAPLTLASELKVAQMLGVDWAVMGSFNVAGDRLAARAQLLEVRPLKLSPALEVSGELGEMVDLQTRLAWRLLATHDPGFTVGKEEDFCRRYPEVRLDAYENYIRGVLAPDPESRVRFLTKSNRLNPADHAAAFELGRLYFEQKDYAPSLDWLRRLNEADAHYQQALFLRAVDKFFLGQDPASEKDFEALSKQMPLNEVWNNLGVLEARRGQYAEARADFERAHQGDPTDSDFCFNRGVSLWYLQRYEAAANSLEEALRVNGDDLEAHSLLGAVLKKLGDSAGEQRQLQWLAEHEGGSAAEPSGDVLPQPRLKKNYDGRAFRLLSLTLHNALEERLAPLPAEEHSAFHLTRGRKFFSEGRLAEAQNELAEAVSLTPNDSAAHLALGQVLEAEGRHCEAESELETSLQLKSSAAAHLSLARVYLALGQPALARDQSQAALALEPSSREVEELIQQIQARAAAQGKIP